MSRVYIWAPSWAHLWSSETHKWVDTWHLRKTETKLISASTPHNWTQYVTPCRYPNDFWTQESGGGFDQSVAGITSRKKRWAQIANSSVIRRDLMQWQIRSKSRHPMSCLVPPPIKHAAFTRDYFKKHADGVEKFVCRFHAETASV